jgi:hypothetical protein
LGLLAGVGISVGYSTGLELANGTISLLAIGCKWCRWVCSFGEARVDGKEMRRRKGFRMVKRDG